MKISYRVGLLVVVLLSAVGVGYGVVQWTGSQKEDPPLNAPVQGEETTVSELEELRSQETKEYLLDYLHTLPDPFFHGAIEIDRLTNSPVGPEVSFLAKTEAESRYCFYNRVDGRVCVTPYDETYSLEWTRDGKEAWLYDSKSIGTVIWDIEREEGTEVPQVVYH